MSDSQRLKEQVAAQCPDVVIRAQGTFTPPPEKKAEPEQGPDEKPGDAE
jgi:hypothetical protein